jgi:hypothetical protein
MTHYTDKNHFFRDENDDRTHVVTSKPGENYEAVLLDHPLGDEVIRAGLVGIGPTRMSAIVRLREAIEAWERLHV